MSLDRVPRGRYVELDGLPKPKDVVSKLWDFRDRRVRRKNDAVVIRGGFSPEDVEEVLPHQDAFGDPEIIRGIERVDQYTQLARSINALMGVDPIDYIHTSGYRTVTSHIDVVFIEVGDDLVDGPPTRGVVVSVGAKESALFGISPFRKGWERLGGDVVDQEGVYIPVSDMRTVIDQGVGDVIIFPPGVVHAVEGQKGRESFVITQNPDTTQS